MWLDSYSKDQMVILGYIFLILPCIFVGLRVWAKWVSRHSLQADDYLIFGGLAFSIGCSITQIVGAIDGELGQHQTLGPDGQPLLNDPRFLTYEKCKFASQMMGVLGVGLTKLSLLVMFRGIFSVSPKFKTASTVLMGITAAWTISFFFSNLFICYPVTPLIEPFYGNKCINSVPMWYTSCISDVLIDLLILILPLPAISKLFLPLKQRLAVAGIFIMGAAVIAISITRLVMYFHVGTTYLEHADDETYYTSPVFFWTNIENSLAVILACLPTLRPLWIFVRGRPLISTSKSYVHDSSLQQNDSSSSNRKPKPESFSELDTINLITRPERVSAV